MLVSFLRLFINEACNFLLVISYLFRLAYFYHFSVVKVLTSNEVLPVFQTKTPALFLAGIGSYFLGSLPTQAIVLSKITPPGATCDVAPWTN
jgi:hypothetical protein